MYKIYIDTTKRQDKSVCVMHEKKTVFEKTGDIDIVQTISDWLQENKIEPEQISEVVPNTGPGSFTGIKIGITIANLMNWALKNNTKKFEPNYGGEPNIQK